jgi:hypothetical protein
MKKMNSDKNTLIEQIEIPASPRRLIEGLADLAYSPQGSICDIIDNSISHGKASEIFILFQFDYEKDKFDFVIYDNGVSMDYEGLKNAMKLGSSDEYKDLAANLGKYGMGMKTASLAYSDNLAVIAKCKDCKPELIEMSKDLILKNDKWIYNRYGENKIVEEINNIKSLLKPFSKKFNFFPSNGSYTVLKWSEISGLNRRAREYKRPSAKENWIEKLITEVESHIRMVFNRFLDGRSKCKKVRINYNGVQLAGWDPCQPHLADTITFRIKGQLEDVVKYKFPQDKRNEISLKQFIVSKLKEDKDKIKIIQLSQNNRPVKLENMQGIYVYRNNRLIDYGKWLDDVGSEPHSTYARAELNLTGDHDDFFRLNVNKTDIDRVDNDHFLEWLIPYSQKLRSEAKKKYGKEMTLTVSKTFNKKQEIVNKVINEIATEQKLTIKTTKGKTTVTNSYGSFFIDEIKAKNFKAKVLKERITSEELKSKQYLWKVLPDTDKTMRVIINKSNELHKLYYLDVEKNKKQVDIINAFLLALSFAEISCRSDESEKIFEAINLAIGDLLNKLIENKIIT